MSVEILQRAAEPGLRRQNPRARGIVGVADLERALRDFDLELRQSIACFEQSFLAGVLHQVRRVRCLRPYREAAALPSGPRRQHL